MGKRKNIYSTLKKACALVIIFFLGMSHEMFANKIELADSALIIYNVGKQHIDSVKFRVASDQTLPAQILMDELALTYRDKKKNILTIVKNGTDTFYSYNCIGGITRDEINKGIRLYIDTDAEYLFSHGDKTWKLSFNNKPEAAESVSEGQNAELEGATNGLNGAKKQKEGTSSAQIILIILAVLLIALCGFDCYKRGFLKPQKSNSESGEGESREGEPEKGESGNEESQREESKQEESEQKDSEQEESQLKKKVEVSQGATDEPSSSEVLFTKAQVEDAKTAAKNELLNSLNPEYGDNYSLDEKCDRLNKELNSGKTAKEELANLKRALGHDEDYETVRLVQDIKNLREKAKAEISSSLIDSIKQRDNKTLNSLIEKAREECGASNDPNYAILMKFFKLLPQKLSASPAQVVDNGVNFESLMNKTENRAAMRRWVISQLEMEGCKGLSANKNNTANLFQTIAEQLNAASKFQGFPTEKEIVDDAVERNKLTEEQRKKLLDRLIERINKEIDESSAKFDSSISLQDFVAKVAEKVQTPSSHEEAEEKVRKNALKAVNKLLKSELTDLDQKSLEEAFNDAILTLLNKKLKGLDAESYDDAMSKLSEDVENSKDINKLLNDYNASKVNDLPQAVKEKNASDLLKSIGQKVNELLPGKNFDSIQKLVNALIGLAEDAKISADEIADELEEKISMRDNQFEAPENRDVNKLIKEYSDLVDKKEAELKGSIKTKDEEIQKLESSLSEKEIENSTLSAKNTVLMSETDALVESLHKGADNIMGSWRTILNACSDNDESQCQDIEDRLIADLEKTTRSFKNFDIENDVKPADARKRIQTLLVDELSKENNPINTICRYYAYSRLPFMTDTSREYGVTFNRKNISLLFNSIESLYVQFGINLNIPNLFVAGFEEGNFENLTGKSYGDLDNLCQNSRNHFDNIDSNAKPSNVIVDVVNVGYTIDGKEGRLSSVLTY